MSALSDFPTLSRADADTLTAEAARWEADLADMLAVLGAKGAAPAAVAQRLRDGAELYQAMGVPKPRIGVPAGSQRTHFGKRKPPAL